MHGWSQTSVLARFPLCAARVECAQVEPTELPHGQRTFAATAGDDSGPPSGAIGIWCGSHRLGVPFELIVSSAIASMEPRALGRGAGIGHRNCAPFSGLEPNAPKRQWAHAFAHTHTHTITL